MRTPLRVAVLCSHRAPGLIDLLTREPLSARPWQVVCCLTSEPAFEEEAFVRAHGIHVMHHPVRRFYGERRRQSRLTDRRVRAEYDAITAEALRPWAPDVVLLAGYLLVLTQPMLDAFPSRIFNVHHSDLLLSAPDGGPLYPGLRAVRDAVMAGERETRATSHVVTEHLDDGPPLVRSWAFPVAPAAAWAVQANERDVLRAIVWAHQEWVLRAAFGPLMANTLDLVADDALDGTLWELDEDGRLPVVGRAVA